MRDDGFFTTLLTISALAICFGLATAACAAKTAAPQPAARAAAVTVSGLLSDARGCPAAMPSVIFHRVSDGAELGAAVSCGAGGPLGFATSIEPGVYDVRVEEPSGRVTVAHGLQFRGEVTDLPLALLLEGPVAAEHEPDEAALATR
jgi:hypothetical protein